MAPCEERGTGGGCLPWNGAGPGAAFVGGDHACKADSPLTKLSALERNRRGMHLRNALVSAARNHSWLRWLRWLVGSLDTLAL